MNFRVQRYRGQPVLTWWQGRETNGYGRGEYVIADDSYHEITRFSAGGRPGDFHEFLLTPRGTALVTVYREVPFNLSRVGGPEHGTVLESVIEEIDVETGRVLFTWRALDHVSLAESHQEVPSDPEEAFDHFHVNSVDLDHDGNLLVSARHTDTVYKIDRRTGEVIWRLGGKRSDFDLAPGARFSSQHDARRQPDGTLTLFDNADPPPVRQASRAVGLRLNTNTQRATLQRRVKHPHGLLSESQGNVQTLSGDELLVGWGKNPYISRFNNDGQLRFDAHFPAGTNIYRAYQHPWSARPTSHPAIKVTNHDEDEAEVDVHASFNGATKIMGWQVLAGPRPHALRKVAYEDWEDFETTITTHTRYRYLAVRALAESGRSLGKSRVTTVQDRPPPEHR